VAVRPLLQYRNPDSTLDLNSTQARIVDRAIFDGGSLTLSGVSLQVTVAPFIATGYDGMVAISDASEVLSVPAPAAAGPNRVSYLILHLEYRTLTSPIVNLQVIPETTWLTSVSRNFFVTFARFEIPFGATSLTDPGVIVDYSPGDWADKLGKTGWRAPVANLAALPTAGNRDGDSRVTLDTNTIYVWDSGSSSWTVAGGALDLAEVTARSSELDAHVQRSFNGSGLISSIDNDHDFGDGGYHHYGAPGVPIVAQSSIANRVDLLPMHVLVNGHFIKTPLRQITLSAPALNRYDLIYLDVWRETIASPAAETYPNDPTLGGTSTFAQLRSRLESLLEGFTTPNSGFTKIELVDSTTYVVTRWAIRLVDGVPSTVINDPSTAAASATNVDGAFYSILASQTDQRLWQAASVSSYDGISWAIPLAVVRRTTLEVGPASYVQVTRVDSDYERFVFDIAPRAELGLAEYDKTLALESASLGSDQEADCPSGFLEGATEPFTYGPGSMTIPTSTLIVGGLRVSSDGAPVSFPLPAAPGAGVRRDLVVIEFLDGPHQTGDVRFSSLPYVSRRSRQGVRRSILGGRVRVFDVGTDITEEDAMTTAGYLATSDPGLWSRPPQPFETSVRAVPVALVHRRNTGIYSPTTASGRNAADRSALPGLPNNAADTPYDYEVLDLRHRIVDDDESDLLMQESFDALLRGTLRTNFKIDPVDPGTAIAGTQLLQVDRIVAGPAGVGYFGPTPDPMGHICVWSESDEAQLLSWNFFNLNSAQNDGTGTFSWSGGHPTATLTITAPPGMHLNFDQNLNLDPIVAPRGFFMSIADGAALTTDRSVRSVVSWTFVSSTNDVDGNRNSVTLNVTLPATASPATCTGFVQCWAVKPSRGSSTTYLANQSLYAIPDEVLRVDLNGTERINVGPIIKTITVATAGAPATAVITQADLAAAFPELGTPASIQMYGVADIAYSGTSMVRAGGLNGLRFVRLTDSAGISTGFERMELEFDASVPANTARVTIMCAGDALNKWVEINPGSKQVRGLYSWARQNLASPASARSPGSPPISDFGNSTPLAHIVPFREVGLFPYGISSHLNHNANTSVESTFLLYRPLLTSYTYWTSPADLATVGFGAGDFRAQSSEDPNPAVVGPWASFMSVQHPGGGNPDVTVIGVQRRGLTAAESLRIFYTYTPYQGISSSLSSYLHGQVEAVNSQVLTTSGPNLSTVSPREISITGYNDERYIYQNSYRGFSVNGSDVGYPDSSGIDFYSLRSLGLTEFARTDQEGVLGRPEDRPLLSVTSRVPFPLDSNISGSEHDVRYSHAFSSETDHTTTYILDSSIFSGSSSAGWTFEESAPDVWRWRSTAAGSVYFPISPPSGRGTITHIWLDVGSTGPSISLDVELMRRAPSDTTFTQVLDGVVFPFTTNLGDEPARLTSVSPIHVAIPSDTYAIRVFSAVAGALVRGVRYRFLPSFYSAPGSSGPSYAKYVGDSPVSFSKGHKFEINPDFSSWDAVFSLDGKGDYVGQPARGFFLRLNISSLGFSSALFGYNGYLPGGDASTRLTSTFSSLYFVTGAGGANPTARGRELPVQRSTPNQNVHIPGHRSSAALISSWLIRNFEDRAVLGVGTGVGRTPNNSYDAFVSSASAVDAFFPKGRPLFKRTK